MPAEEAGEAGGPHEQGGIVDPPRWAPGDPLTDDHQGEPRPERVVDRVEDQYTARTDHPRDLLDDPGEVVDVLEDLPRHDDVGHPVTEGRDARRPNPAPATTTSATRSRRGRATASARTGSTP